MIKRTDCLRPTIEKSHRLEIDTATNTAIFYVSENGAIDEVRISGEHNATEYQRLLVKLGYRFNSQPVPWDLPCRYR